MKVAPNPVNEFDSVKFDDFMKAWQKRLNLMDWRLVRSRKKTKNSSEVKIEVAHKLATYMLGPNFGAEKVDDQSLEDTAVHELLHVLLAELIEVTATAGHSDEQRWGAEHRVINTLLTLLVPKQ